MKETLEDLRDVLRDYLAGMTLLTLLVIAASSLFFWILGLDFPVVTGIASGLLNMVPYIGAVLAWLPAFIIALAKSRTFGEVRLDCRRSDGHSCARPEFSCAANCWAARALERRRDHDFAALLGMGMGRHGVAAGDSHHGGAARDLRPHRIPAADWALAKCLMYGANGGRSSSRA